MRYIIDTREVTGRRKDTEYKFFARYEVGNKSTIKITSWFSELTENQVKEMSTEEARKEIKKFYEKTLKHPKRYWLKIKRCWDGATFIVR